MAAAKLAYEKASAEQSSNESGYPQTLSPVSI